MKPIFLDSGFVIALESSTDQYHSEALKQWRETIPSTPRLVTTSLLFSEVVTFFNTRRRHAKAVEIGNRLLWSPTITIYTADDDLLEAGWNLFSQHSDKTFSLADCVSFVLMKRLGIHEALTFDNHFRQAGFATLPSHSNS